MCFSKIIPIIKPKPKVKIRPGDFSFITSKHKRFILEIDYNAINSSPHGWEMLAQMERYFMKSEYHFHGISLWDTPLNDTTWYPVQRNMYMGHTNESLTRSILLLRYMYKYGWNKFVMEYPKIIN